MRILLAASLLAFVGAASCTTMNSARPLAPGQHAAAITAGGPLVDVPGVGVIPMPHVTVEGRHGLVHHLDVNYGLHLLPIVYGVLGGHVGATYLLAEEKGGGLPALSIGERLFLFSNRLDLRKPEEKRAEWALSQTELTASWMVPVFDVDQMIYAGAAAYVPLFQPHPYFAPFVGVEVRPGVDWVRLQLEGRWVAPYVNTQYAVVDWVAPGLQGGIIVNAGVAFVLDWNALFAPEGT